MSKSQKPQKNNGEVDNNVDLLGLEPLVNKIKVKSQAMTSQKRMGYLIGLLLLAGVFATAASLTYPFMWINALIGWPAGVILFILGVGIFYNTNLQNTRVAKIRETKSSKQRFIIVLSSLGFLGLVMFLISFSFVLPTGIGGALLIASVMLAYLVVRRTPAEVELARKGLPDPRDIQENKKK